MPDQKALGFKNEIFGNCKQTERPFIISTFISDAKKKKKSNQHLAQ